jgi:hypothetical protein
LDQAHKKYDNRDDKENVNESSHGVRRDESEQPHDYKDDDDCFEHGWIPLRKCSVAARNTPPIGGGNQSGDVLEKKLLRVLDVFGGPFDGPATFLDVSARTLEGIAAGGDNADDDHKGQSHGELSKHVHCEFLSKWAEPKGVNGGAVASGLVFASSFVGPGAS